MALHHTAGDSNDGNNEGPVTVIVDVKAKGGKTDEFEEWMDGVIHESMKFEGHMGINIIRPSNPSSPEYTIIFRFNTYENLTKWEKSEVRREWIEKGKAVIEGESAVQRQTGLEFALMVVVIMVLLMTYLIMPAVTRLLRPWLSKKTLL